MQVLFEESVTDIIVGFFFLAVVKRGKLCLLSVFLLQCVQDQPVGKLRVLRKQRSMEVGSDHILVHNTFITGFTVISRTIENFAKRFVIVDTCPSTVVLKTDDRHLKQVALKDDVADETALLLLCIHIYKFQPLDRSLVRLVVISKELINAADSDNDSIILYICL